MRSNSLEMCMRRYNLIQTLNILYKTNKLTAEEATKYAIGLHTPGGIDKIEKIIQIKKLEKEEVNKNE